MKSFREHGVVSCMKCTYHFITYDPRFPYGCRALGFKSKRPPQYEVAGASLQPCFYYQEKARSREDA